MRIIETKVYLFDELNDKAKEKAREWFREVALDHEWYDATYEDAERIGLKITAFDLGRGQYVEAKFLFSAEETAHLIEKEHGENCETFRDAKNYLKSRDGYIDLAEKDVNGDFVDEMSLDAKLDQIDEEFRKTLCEDYRVILQNEMEYLLSDESIDENIRINEYEFTETGKRS